MYSRKTLTQASTVILILFQEYMAYGTPDK